MSEEIGHQSAGECLAVFRERYWEPFKPLRCPALTGIAAFEDGGFLDMRLDLSGRTPAVFVWHPLVRHAA